MQRNNISQLTKSLVDSVASLPLSERVEALNAIREALHEISPFKSEPVDLVLWIRGELIGGNDYNPNAVAPPEMKLLAHSIEEDGYTQPIVAFHTAAGEEVVDGFHRHRCGKEIGAIKERVHGYLPITRINTSRESRSDRIASTIRHNRARGEHSVGKMSEIVRMLHVSGWTDEQIQKELGMEIDEVLRLKQITGLAALFANRDFSEAWEVIR